MGFFILLGLIAYVVLAKFIVSALGKYTQNKAAKYIAIAVFVLIPTWDIVPGYLYFNHLCEKEAGVKVFKTVEVDRTYFIANGQPDEKKLADHYGSSFKVDRDFSAIFHITKIESAIQDKRTGETLGTATSLTYYWGWLNAYLFSQGSSSTCPAGHVIHGIVWQKVIKPKQVVQEGGH